MAFATPLPDARSVAGSDSDRPLCQEAARAPPHCSLSPDLPDRENPEQILVELVPQWPDVICPYGRLGCDGSGPNGMAGSSQDLAAWHSDTAMFACIAADAWAFHPERTRLPFQLKRQSLVQNTIQGASVYRYACGRPSLSYPCPQSFWPH